MKFKQLWMRKQIKKDLRRTMTGRGLKTWKYGMDMMVLNGNQLLLKCGKKEKVKSIMRICFHGNNTDLQLNFKNIQVQLCCNYILQSATPMQLQYIITMI